MTKRTLPTGEEPRKGYETIMSLNTNDAETRVKGSFLSQLSSAELHEIESLRLKSMQNVSEYTGLSAEPYTFEHESNIIPNKSASDKMVFRARKNKQLVGYAFVVIGWPRPASWVIQHMIIDPEYRLQGIGTSLVQKIEAFAQDSDIDAASIYAVPVQKSGIDFWNSHGYTKVSAEHLLRFGPLDHELLLYSKEIDCP
jgi:GNAT superfamily N-acetyltransferase